MSVYTTFKLILCVINIILTNVQKIWDELRDAKTMKTIVRKKKKLTDIQITYQQRASYLRE